MFPRKFQGKVAQSKIKGGNFRVFQIVLWGTEGMPLVGTENLAGRIFFFRWQESGEEWFRPFKSFSKLTTFYIKH